MADKIAGVDWEAWFLQEGMPPVEPKYDLSLLGPVKVGRSHRRTRGRRPVYREAHEA